MKKDYPNRGNVPIVDSVWNMRISVLSRWILPVEYYDVLCADVKAREANQVYGRVLSLYPLSCLS
jgi:hypothetical protein